MFNLFATLNNSLIANSIITTALALVIVYLVLDFTMYAIADCCLKHKTKQQRINSIPTMTKRELIALARDYGIRYSRLNKYELQNKLIWELA